MVLDYSISVKIAFLLCPNYRLTDMHDTFFVALLSFVWASNTTEARKMKSVAPASVFAFRDAPSHWKISSRNVEQLSQH